MKKGILPFALLLALLLEGSGASRPAFDQENCSLCHIRESVFFDPSFLAPEEKKTFDEERICGSCHNGSVQDSRAVLWKGAQHPALPKEKGGGRTCAACHSPHVKGGWGVLAGSGVSLRKGGSAVCAGCHPDHATKPGTLHAGRIGEAGCPDCHAAHGGSGKALLRETGSALCLRCHASIDPARIGGHPLEGRGVRKGGEIPLPGCLECHPVHRSGKDAARSVAACGSCHRFAGGNADAVGASHPGEETCTTCHTFHAKAGEGGRAFRGKEIRAEELCRGCHASRWAADVKAGRAAGTHVTTASAEGGEICSRCHRMHEAPAGTPLLRSSKPYSCLECHAAQNTIREEGGIALAHPVFEMVPKGRLTETVREKGLLVGSSGEIVCRTCHKVHDAVKGTPLLSPGSEKAESCFWCHPAMRGKSHGGAAPGTVIRCLECHPVHGGKNSDGDPWRTLCRRCHPVTSQHRESAEGRETGRTDDLPGFDPRGRQSPFGAVTCPTCHDPHGGGEGAKRLRKPYRPNGFLCTACHRKQDTVVLTPHDLRGISGNSVCEPCHRPHGGDPPWMWGPARGSGEIGEASCRACHLAGKGKGLGSRLPLGGHPTNIIASRPLPDRFPRIGPDGETSRDGVVSCPTCHDVHGSGVMPVGRGVGKLLRRSGTEGSGDLRNAEICSECHPGKAEKHGTADCLSCHPPHSDEEREASCRKCHPVEGGTLFDRHRKAGKGCGSCHKVHGNDTKGERREEPCYGCHPATRKIRGTSHASQGGGACGTCHPVHRDSPGTDVRPKLGEEIFRPDLPCLRCHREDGDGPVPGRLKHPALSREVPTNYGATVTLETPVTMFGRFKEGDRPMFPLFDPSGKRSLSGAMGCLTCHDPHAGGTRDGKPEANGYLRDPGFVFLSDMCAPCHRSENVERIRNFHKMPVKMR